MALSKRLPMIQHRSISEDFSRTGIWASAVTAIPLALAREILELRIASAIGLPVLITVSTVVRSLSRRSRYRRMASQSSAERKLGKLDRLFRSEADAAVTFSMERGRFIVEATIRAGGMIYRVTETTGDMYASIDSAAASIERQIRKNKTRLEKRLREGAFEREIKPAVLAPEDDEPEDFSVVRTKRFSIFIMTV